MKFSSREFLNFIRLVFGNNTVKFSNYIQAEHKPERRLCSYV